MRELPVPAFKLRNARQSEMYSEALAWEPASALVRLVDVLMPPDLGLQFDLVTGRAEGTPHRSGEFSIPLHYRYADDPPEARRPAVLRLYVNADPKLLWKNLPSDTADPFWKPDEAEQTLVGPLRRVVAARKRGRSHAHVGSCCDDDFLIHHDIDGDWYVGIVADGAGSAQFSRRGSQLAVRAAGAHVKQALAGEAGEKVAAAVLAVQEAASDEAASHARRVLQNALYVVVGHAAYMAMRALVDEAQACSDRISAVKELATTLLIGVARKFGTQWLCAAYWVGDGAVGVYRRDQSVELLGEVDAGEYSGQTRFLDKNEVTQEALNKRTRFTLCDDFTAFVLMTDGVSDPKFETEARLANLDAWNALWEDLEANAGLAGAAQGQKLLDWLDFWSQGNHDDRTIAIIY
ncbi:MAG: protein phosphatase 2C domain-containing protein [Rhodocyclaceae bacterium]|nr:protein phosphatase 2C domain-containing protein [Rhodocyclaceae bacterium]